MKISQISTNLSFDAEDDYINYINIYKNMIEDLGEVTKDEPLPVPEHIHFELFEELYKLYCKIQEYYIDNQRYIDYFRDNYELFMNSYPRQNIGIPHSKAINSIFSDYDIKTLCIFIKLCDFFDMPIISKIVGMGIATLINNKSNPDEIKTISYEIKQHLENL